MSCSTVLDAPDVAAVVDRLRAGDVFTALVAERVTDRAAALERVLRDAAGEGTRTVWVGNPLRSPLTIERFLLQILGPEIDLRIDRTPAELADLLARPAGGETRLLVVVQQPETINPETEETLGAMAAHLDGRAVQFLFAGSPSLRLPRSVRPVRQVPPPAPERPAAPVHIPTSLSTGGRRDMLPVAALLSIAGLGLLLSAWPSTKDPNAAPVHVRLSLEEIASPVSDSILFGMSRMREEFDRLIADHAATLPPLTDAQKDALFQEFVVRYRKG